MGRGMWVCLFGEGVLYWWVLTENQQETRHLAVPPKKDTSMFGHVSTTIHWPPFKGHQKDPLTGPDFKSSLDPWENAWDARK